MPYMKLLSSKNTKLEKGTKYGWMTLGLSLVPHKMSGVNLCPNASPGCSAACLYSAGMGRFPTVKQGRMSRAKLFNADKAAFLAQLETEISKATRQASKLGLRLAIRLNVLSDIAWEKFGLMEKFPTVQFYDYTKSPFRMVQYLGGKMPKNYSLTFSRSENNAQAVNNVLALGGNVAVVFRGKLPPVWNGKQVVSGDESDLRFLDAQSCIVGLVEKGLAKADATGFVVEPA